ncbi:MAG: DUF4129 domain-containing protein [Planctomycetes bacterium]|nr:DUF4129 domain-containing protein [Planctomycetota bacterium]
MDHANRIPVAIGKGAAMGSRKTEHTPADYVAMALSPALIMALVGSLVFFLLEILYAGEYTGRLQWMLFFFIFGAVLIARIAMQPDIASRAQLYGGVMGLLVWLGLLMYIEYPSGSAADFGWAINLGLIALIWWCAYQLTWDCTFLDDQLGSSGQGVLQAAGLEGGRPQDASDEEAAQDEKKDEPEPIDWLQRYWRYRAKRNQKRTPGVWIVYFSLAALPIFGLGQSLIPVAEASRRQYSFWLMVIYVGSGLGLLLTTTFLGLRTYLRGRKLQMPVAMTGVWLAIGGTLIAMLLVGGALLPRPNAEVQLFDVDNARSKSPQASRSNVKEADAGKGEGDPHEGREGKDKAGGKDGAERKPGDQQSSNDDRRGNQGSAQKDGSQSGGQKEGENKSGSKRPEKKEAGNRERKDAQAGEERKDEQAEKEDREKEHKEGKEHKGNSSRPLSERVSSWMRGLAPVLKWIVFGLMAAVVLFFVLRAFLQFVANFSTFARNLLDSFRRFWEALLALFGRKKEKAEAVGNAEPEEAPVPPRPFSSFSNPFHDGRAGRLALPELVRYTFAALQAWAHERDLGRQPGETPLEFAARLGEEVPPLERDVQRLALLYVRAVYARGGLPANSRDALEQFWDQLMRTTEQPLSA